MPKYCSFLSISLVPGCNGKVVVFRVNK